MYVFSMILSATQAIIGGIREQIDLSVVLLFTYSVGILQSSRKHAYIILTPLNPTFFRVKLGFTGIYIIFSYFC